VRYSEALERGRKQDAIMQDVMKHSDIEKIWDDDELHEQIIKQLLINNSKMI